MSFKKNQKEYNKDVMRTGKQANQYLNNALGLINQYTTDYAGRNDFWTNKLNNRQLDLLSDKYLAENARMLRGSAAFGSTSDVNRRAEQNAYEQQNYLANVANQNVQIANQLQQNELGALMGAAQTYQSPISMGASAAQNVDAANWSWLNALGQGAQTAGSVLQAIPTPWTQAIGGALNTAGGAITSMTSSPTSLDASQARQQQQEQIYGSTANTVNDFKNWLQPRNTSTQGVSSSSLSNIGDYSLNTQYRRPSFKGFGTY